MILEPKKKVPKIASSVRLPQDLLDQIDKIAKERGYSRNEVIEAFLRLGLKSFRKQFKK